jgi:hypothetical protein
VLALIATLQYRVQVPHRERSGCGSIFARALAINHMLWNCTPVERALLTKSAYQNLSDAPRIKGLRPVNRASERRSNPSVS